MDVSRTCLPAHAKTSDPLLIEAFPAAFSAMAALEAGGIANPDEGRRVGHYWLRAPELAPEPELSRAIEETVARVKAFAADIHAGKIAPETAGHFRNVLLIGIGGSALGPQLVADALGTADDRMRLFFFDNTDPDGIAREMDRIAAAGGIARTLTVVVSKSGGTKETRNGMLVAQAAYTAKGLDFGRHAVAVTQDGSDLDKIARRQKWLARFPMWDWVGGRTSQLSAVGLLPAALQGLDVDGLLEGARACDAATRIPDVGKNPAALLALAWYRETEGRGKKDMVVLPYKDRLILLSRYLQQLVMESLGKEKDLSGSTVHQGIAVYGNKGSTDQHAFVQQLREGVPNFFVTFIEVLKDRQRRPPLARRRGGRHLRRLPPRLLPRDARGALRERARLGDDHRRGRLRPLARRARRALRADGRPLRPPRRRQRLPPAGGRGGKEGGRGRARRPARPPRPRCGPRTRRSGRPRSGRRRRTPGPRSRGRCSSTSRRIPTTA